MLSGRWRRNFYAECNGSASGDHRVDDDVERRVGDENLKQQIIAAQDGVTAALGDRRRLYLSLEELVGQRSAVREEAMFNAGYEHGYIEGRQEALGAVWRRTTRGRAFAKKITYLALDSRLTEGHAIGALLEVAWSLLTRPRNDATSRPPSAGGSPRRR